MARGALAALFLGTAIGVMGASAPDSRTGAATPTFAKDVAPIIYAHCAGCHRPGQSAPFALLSYGDVKKRGDTIADVIERRYMPPWHAEQADGFAEFRDDRRLTTADLATITAWVDAGMPSGDLSKAPAPPTFATGWTLGTPDLLVDVPRPVDVPADGPDEYRNVLVPIDLPDDRWVTALDFEPSVRAVLHHALFFISPVGATVREGDTLPGVNPGRGGLGVGGRGGRVPTGLTEAADAWSGFGPWVPGVTPRFYPDGMAQALPKHTNLVIQLHLHPSGKPEREGGRLAIYFAKAPPKTSLTGVQVPPIFGFGVGIDIPAGDSHYAIHDTFTLPVDVRAYGARAHTHYLGREMKMIATLPDGSTRGLLWIKNWDLNWQDSYFYQTPFALPKGTVLDTTIVYDNSAANPHNPHDPPINVRWGEQSVDEMGTMTLLVASPAGADAELLRAAEAQHFREQLAARVRR